MSFLDSIKQMFGKGDGLPIVNVERRFELLGRTGQGSMSKVWRARDRESGKTICLKVLDKVKTAAFEKRFTGLKKPSEGEICMLLKHRNVVQTLEYGWTTDKEPYIIMELVEGVGLNYLIETKNKQLEGNRINYLTQYANGIEYMHRAGFLHRDICPRNVMVNKEGIVKIIDLGLTIPFKPDFCKPGNRTGTTSHLAPEIIKRMTTDGRVDLFALGVTAYELFTLEFRPNMEPAVVEFLLKGVERDAKNRFQTPAEFRDTLAKLPAHW